MSISIVIKCGQGHGYGHLKRMEILTEYFQKINLPVKIYDIQRYNPKNDKSNIVIFDAREVKNSITQLSISLGKKVISFDDTSPENLSNVLIYSLPALPEFPKPNFQGENYIILDPKIDEIKSEENKNIIISFGGEDPNNITGKLLERFVSINEIGLKMLRNFEIRVILGPLFKETKNILALVNKLNSKNLKTKLFSNLSHRNFLELVANTSLVITSFGMTFYESLAFGKKILLINHSEYHEKLFKSSGLSTETVKSTGVYYNFNEKTFIETFLDLLVKKPKNIFKIKPIENLERITNIILSLETEVDRQCFSRKHSVKIVERTNENTRYFCENCIKHFEVKFKS